MCLRINDPYSSGPDRLMRLLHNDAIANSVIELRAEVEFVESVPFPPLSPMQSTITPQGGVISPLLANLFLHYAFDRWVSKNLPGVPFCRYADDGVLHCKSKEQAELVMGKIGARFQMCGLELHAKKTQIIYCRDVNRREKHPVTSFTFLGYTFCPRIVKDKYGRVYVGFTPAVSREALKAMRQTIRGWHIQLKSSNDLAGLSKQFNPVLKGWMNFYCQFNASRMALVWNHMNLYLMRWLMRKHKSLVRRTGRAIKTLERMAVSMPEKFVHWEKGYIPKGWIMGAG